MIKVKPFYCNEEVQLNFSTAEYKSTGNLYVGAVVAAGEDVGEPWCDITKNLPYRRELAENEAFLDMNNASDVIGEMTKEGYITLTGEYTSSEFCIYPLGRFTEKFFLEVNNKECALA